MGNSLVNLLVNDWLIEINEAINLIVVGIFFIWWLGLLDFRFYAESLLFIDSYKKKIICNKNLLEDYKNFGMKNLCCYIHNNLLITLIIVVVQFKLLV